MKRDLINFDKFKFVMSLKDKKSSEIDEFVVGFHLAEVAILHDIAQSRPAR